MRSELNAIERAARTAHRVDESSRAEAREHPLEGRNVHPRLIELTRALFDDAYYAQASFEALKFVNNEVQRIAKVADKNGVGLMMSVFGGTAPAIQLTAMKTRSEKDEQEGFKLLFAGAMAALRNPRGHEHALKDDVDTCLDHLCFASLLLRRLEAAGYSIAGLES